MTIIKAALAAPRDFLWYVIFSPPVTSRGAPEFRYALGFAAARESAAPNWSVSVTPELRGAIVQRAEAFLRSPECGVA
jgi:hypothetical protein